ncbi:TetR/AcrR family transcriptional regulator [Falsirhodobacter halotolerans]|uniref:TetR/AcrR family transcriptional regulator n=1 Tax=Falsirhodobacter halotolerans TaxID=1146892 RepID=UPI001FCFD53B|nr:TetR/AcrR family transcriptional regulator [Falsirhodobacter halotolerans]
MTRRGYHHGNLRQALVDAALGLIAEKGPQGFTLSEAAKKADVTPAAVYRHFTGRDELIVEIARQGYDIFGALMEFAFDDGKPTALAAFESVGRAYLAFARKYPGHYQAMFESGISVQEHPDLDLAARKATDVLERAATRLSDHLPPEKRPPASMFSAHMWAMAHGVVELYTRGGRRAPFAPDDLLETGIGIYLRGLGLLPQDR